MYKLLIKFACSFFKHLDLIHNPGGLSIGYQNTFTDERADDNCCDGKKGIRKNYKTVRVYLAKYQLNASTEGRTSPKVISRQPCR